MCLLFRGARDSWGVREAPLGPRSSRWVEKWARPCEGASSCPARVLAPAPRRVNVGCGPAEERVLLTGLHAVADIYCENCKTTLGWKYVSHHGDSGPKTGWVPTIKEGPRAGGGEAALTARVTTGWAWAEACGCDSVVMLTADPPGMLGPHSRTRLGPSWRAGGW